MMIKKIVVLAIIYSILISGVNVFSDSTTGLYLELNDIEKGWLKSNEGQEFILGFDPYAGMEYFKYLDFEHGVVLDLEKEIENDLNIRITLEKDKSWGEVFEGLQTGEVDILFGANETPERLEYMSFTQPVYKIPYSVLAKKNGTIFTLGDIDNKKVGFIEGDIVTELMEETYKNIDYTIAYFESQNMALEALELGAIDALISSGGAVVFDYIDEYPNLKQIAEITSITSDMTLSTLKSNSVLADIINKEIEYLKKTKLKNIIENAKINYNYKVMKLTKEEIEWINKKNLVLVGVPYDYLPIDYYNNGKYGGMAGSVLNEVNRMTGIEFTAEQDEFDNLMNKVENDEIDILNMAKTNDRLDRFIFTEPFSYERDIIAGRKDNEYVEDIYSLENKKVAVIEGFWHEEHLKRNLLNPNIVFTKSIEESLEFVADGRADYLIENPYVIKYYIEELDLYNIVEMGSTSKNSFLYFGISNKKNHLASIIDKSFRFIDLEKVMRNGFGEVPHSSQKESVMKLLTLSGGLVFIIVIFIGILVRVARDLIKSKAKTEALLAKEKYIYEDAMTGLYNRHYLYFKVEPHINKWKYPQSIVVCDLNNLKIFNDKYGHDVGDQYLKKFAGLLKENFSEESKIIRLGGDEFLVVLLGIDGESAKRYADLLVKGCSEIAIKGLKSSELKPSTAVGIATRSNQHKTFEEILKEADNKMYEHKRKFKDVI